MYYTCNDLQILEVQHLQVLNQGIINGYIIMIIVLM